MTTYEAPATGSSEKLPLKELLGTLLRIEVLEALTDVQTSFGPANPIRANIVALDGSLKGEEYPDALVFPRVLAGQLRPSVGKIVLGRLSQGAAQPGKSAPWQLTAATPDEIETAKKYDAHIAERNAKQDEAW